MQQPETLQATQQTATEVQDPTAQYLRRRKLALWVTVSLLALSLVVLTVGLISATRTDNVPVTGYYPGIALSFGAFLAIVGIHLVENRRPMLVASIIFISIGVITSFICAIFDGIFAEFIDIRPLQDGMCNYFASGTGYVYDNYYTEVTCPSFNKACTMRVQSNTCYCCYLYNCESIDDYSHYYQFTGVGSCWDPIHLHRLMWTSVVLNVVGMFLGITTAAILGAYKDIQKPSLQMVPSPAPPPHILYNPAQHMLSYPGFCPPGQTLPAYPNYPIPMQHNSYQPHPTNQMMPEAGPRPNCGSEENQNQQPSQAPNQPQPQGATQEQGEYMLTPNAPVLYGAAYNPFEKPPPYAC